MVAFGCESPHHDFVNKTETRYLVRSGVNPALILCTDGEFHADAQVGPGGWCAKLYKTRRGADAVRGGDAIIVRGCDEFGVEK